MLLTLILTIAIATLLLGLLVLLKNPHSRPNQLLFLYACFVNSWIIINYYANDVHLTARLALVMNRAVMVFGAGMVLSLNLLLERLSSVYKPGRRRRLWLSLGFIVACLPLTPWTVTKVIFEANVVGAVFGPSALLYFVVFGGLIIRTFVLSYKAIRGSQGIERARMQVIGLGIVTAFGILFFTNGVVPFFAHSFESSNFGPLGFIVLTATLAYSIVKQRLFDIKPAIVRTIGYVLTLLLLIFAYSLLIGTLTGHFFARQLTIGQDLLSGGLIAIMIILFEPLRHEIDSVSNRLFYRDQYDPQVVIDAVTDVLVSEVSETALLSESMELINRAVNASRIVYIACPSLVCTVLHGPQKGAASLQTLASSLDNDQPLYLRSDIVSSPLDTKLGRLKVDLLMDLGGKDYSVGVLAFGPKRNGSAYSKQDLELLSVLRKTLAVAIQNARNHQEVVDFATTLKHEVQVATKALAKSNADLTELSVAKDEFVSMATHQIRPLLVAARGFLDLLRKETEADERLELNHLATASIERTTRVMTDMLNLSQYSAGKLAMHFQTTDLATAVRREVEAQQSFVRTAGFSTKASLPNRQLLVRLDESKIREVIANLVHNAVQYGSAEKPVVEVSLRVKNGQAICSVKDYGQGIPKSEQQALFSKFYRSSNARARRPSGSGLGLFLANQVITAHGGSMVFTSTENTGSSFGFSLKLL